MLLLQSERMENHRRCKRGAPSDYGLWRNGSAWQKWQPCWIGADPVRAGRQPTHSLLPCAYWCRNNRASPVGMESMCAYSLGQENMGDGWGAGAICGAITESLIVLSVMFLCPLFV